MRRVSQARVARRLPAGWLAEARALISQLVAASTLQRARLIKKNAAVWSQVRGALWAAGGEKCWYSEALLPEGQAEVEHFRPKGRLSGEKYAGYWWLAFDWRNYRLASHLANVRRFDHLNGAMRGKGSYFPLAAGARATFVAIPPADDPLRVKCEKPLLLDPIEADDVRLLTFDQDGLPRHDPVAATTAGEKERVEKSIAFYSLDDGMLNARRADLWKVVHGWSEELEQLFSIEDKRPFNADELRRLSELRNLVADAIDQGAEFSAVAITALRTRGDRGWNTELVAAAG